MKAALEQGAQRIVAAQKALVPVASGDLRDSIDYTFGNYKATKGMLAASGGTGDPDLTVTIHAGSSEAYYARWMEFGISRSWTVGGKFEGATHPGFTAQPFFYPAYRAHKRKVVSRVRRVAKKAIKDSL